MLSLRHFLTAPALLLVLVLPGAAQSGSFGNSVVVLPDELIIAEPNNTFRSGVVYVYRKSGGTWREAQRLTAPDAERADGFGAALAATGRTLFVAQRGGRIHVFSRDGSDWRARGTLGAPGVEGLDPGCNQYGYCGTDFGLAMAAAGDWLLVGEPGSPAEPPRSRGRRDAEEDAPPPSGVVHAFRRADDGAWQPAGQLRLATGAPGDRFGAAVALGDGFALVGAPGLSAGSPPEPDPGRRGGQAAAEAAPPPQLPGAGRVFEFRLENGAWREGDVLPVRAEAHASLGASLGVDGQTAVIGAPGSADGHGAAFLLERNATGVWTEQARLAAFAGVRGDRFGTAVAVDGADVWVGAPARRGLATGMVYLFGSDPDEEVPVTARRIRLAETVEEDAFGARAAADGGVAAVTAAGMHHEAGAVVVYERGATGAWSEAAMLVSPPDALAAIVGEKKDCTEGSIGPFDCSGVDLLAFIPTSMLRAPEHARGVRTNDNWGWTDPETGREYALVGRNDGTSFIDITDPSNPVLIGDLPKTPATPRSQLWRDIKVYENHAFIVADGAGEHGMQVFDLTRLRDVANPPALFEPDVLYRGEGDYVITSSHNIAINEETGFAFLIDRRCAGLHMVDIREPTAPKFAGCADPGSTHDVQCIIYRGPDERYRGREICLRSAADDFIISDVTDRSDPVQLATASHPNPGYLHQGWVTEDHRYFLMDDESDLIQGNVESTRTLVWDLTDLEDPRLVTEFMGSMPASAHNQYVKGDLSYQANYRYGLHVLDVSDPENPREVGWFDTSPYQTGPGFSGAWSTFPFFDSGTVIVTSLQEGLLVLRKRGSPVL